MTIKEAIEKIKSDIELCRELEEDSAQFVEIDVLQIAVEALEKQVIKEPKFSVKEGSLICPKCGWSIFFQYCPNCGQRLGWSKEEENEIN